MKTISAIWKQISRETIRLFKHLYHLNKTFFDLQILFPFLIAGLGMVAAGIVLDTVQHWTVFKEINELFILVPALLGLKGNLEMTLASRLSTLVRGLCFYFKGERLSFFHSEIASEACGGSVAEKPTSP